MRRDLVTGYTALAFIGMRIWWKQRHAAEQQKGQPRQRSSSMATDHAAASWAVVEAYAARLRLPVRPGGGGGGGVAKA
jgi:hypothetical protein